MADELVHLEISGGVATVTLDSPENRNALSRKLMSDLKGHLDAALADQRARVVVLTGTGSVFCAGADLKEQRSANEAREGSTLNAASMPDMLNDIWESPKPVLARINGHARAGGIGLLGACDMAVAVEDATFSFSEVRIGVAPAIISVVTVPKIGITRAMELFLTGDTFTAREAAAMGLINAAVPASELDAAVGRYARALILRFSTAGADENFLADLRRILRKYPGRTPVHLRLETPAHGEAVVETEETVALGDGLFGELGAMLGDRAWQIESGAS